MSAAWPRKRAAARHHGTPAPSRANVATWHSAKAQPAACTQADQHSMATVWWNLRRRRSAARTRSAQAPSAAYAASAHHATSSVPSSSAENSRRSSAAPFVKCNL